MSESPTSLLHRSQDPCPVSAMLCVFCFVASGVRHSKHIRLCQSKQRSRKNIFNAGSCPANLGVVACKRARKFHRLAPRTNKKQQNNTSMHIKTYSHVCRILFPFGGQACDLANRALSPHGNNIRNLKHTRRLCDVIAHVWYSPAATAARCARAAWHTWTPRSSYVQIRRWCGKSRLRTSVWSSPRHFTTVCR